MRIFLSEKPENDVTATTATMSVVLFPPLFTFFPHRARAPPINFSPGVKIVDVAGGRRLIGREARESSRSKTFYPFGARSGERVCECECRLGNGERERASVWVWESFCNGERERGCVCELSCHLSTLMLSNVSQIARVVWVWVCK